MRRKTLDEMVVRMALESKRLLDNKELPRGERHAAYTLLKATAKYAEAVGYKGEFVRLLIEQYEDDRNYAKRRGVE
jgi:hypothetical protein